ncbi:hypothetical protein [Desulfocurvus sp. DL9XJH121]
MPRPEPEVRVQRFPLDRELSFFRLTLTDRARTDVLALLAEAVEKALAPVTHEVKVNLSEDGGAFIMAFLADKRPLDEQAVHELLTPELKRHGARFDT